MPEPQPLEKLIAELVLDVKWIKARLAADPVVLSEAWEPAAIAATKLGISASRLKQLRRDGILTEAGGQIRNVSRGDRPTWEYHISRCQQAIERHKGRAL